MLAWSPPRRACGFSWVAPRACGLRKLMLDSPMVKLEEITVIRAPIERCFDLARSVEVHLAGNIHFGEAAVALAGVTSGLLGLGQRVTWRARHLGAWRELTSEITAMDRPAYFQDTMV